MLSYNVKNFRISFTFGFFFILALSSLRGSSLGGLSLLFCMLHELGHLFMMKAFGVDLSELKFYGSGIKITSNGLGMLPKPRQAAVYLAGPLTNIMLGLALRGIMGSINFALAVFNLLPISYLDGGRLLGLVISEKAVKALSGMTISILAALLIFAAVAVPKILGPSAVMSFGFMFLAVILDG